MTVVDFVPSMLRAFLQETKTTGPAVTTLRCVICGGEELPVDAVYEFFERFGGETQLFNQYGPTEARSRSRRGSVDAGEVCAGGSDRPSDAEHACVCAG